MERIGLELTAWLPVLALTLISLRPQPRLIPLLSLSPFMGKVRRLDLTTAEAFFSHNILRD